MAGEATPRWWHGSWPSAQGHQSYEATMPTFQHQASDAAAPSYGHVDQLQCGTTDFWIPTDDTSAFFRLPSTSQNFRMPGPDISGNNARTSGTTWNSEPNMEYYRVDHLPSSFEHVPMYQNGEADIPEDLMAAIESTVRGLEINNEYVPLMKSAEARGGAINVQPQPEEGAPSSQAVNANPAQLSPPPGWYGNPGVSSPTLSAPDVRNRRTEDEVGRWPLPASAVTATCSPRAKTPFRVTSADKLRGQQQQQIQLAAAGAGEAQQMEPSSSEPPFRNRHESLAGIGPMGEEDSRALFEGLPSVTSGASLEMLWIASCALVAARCVRQQLAGCISQSVDVDTTTIGRYELEYAAEPVQFE
ncbi:uncharacterized protein LOC142774242 [Rhipicephalus microplus]|uniref:uncharacterized protein LOC142774242 n=1 Tax=Rhipicephalus microplus TaxID=6941 RepID=UPI003F6C813C